MPEENNRVPTLPAEAGLRPTPPACRALRVAGEIDLSNRHELDEALRAAALLGEDIHLELGELTFIDVGSVTVLVQAAMRLPPGRRMVLHDPPRSLRRIIALCWGSLGCLEVVDTA